MNRISYLLDTNLVIGLLKAFPDALDLIKIHPDILERCAVSQITRMELLGFPGIDTESQQ
jgi:predicted nucleic acid-binding protein